MRESSHQPSPTISRPSEAKKIPFYVFSNSPSALAFTHTPCLPDESAYDLLQAEVSSVPKGRRIKVQFKSVKRHNLGDNKIFCCAKCTQTEKKTSYPLAEDGNVRRTTQLFNFYTIIHIHLYSYMYAWHTIKVRESLALRLLLPMYVVTTFLLIRQAYRSLPVNPSNLL